MHKTGTGIVFAVVMIAIIVAMDLLLFRNHAAARLAANVAVVAVALGVYWVLFRRA